MAMSRTITRRGALASGAALASAGVLAACGGAPASGGEPGRLTKENLTLRFSAWGDPSEAQVWQEISSAYSTKRPNIKVEFEHMPTDYEQKLLTMHVGGAAPHVMSIKDEPFPRYAAGGVYADLTNLAKRDAREMKLEDYWPRWLEMFRWDEAIQRTNVTTGKLHGIPWGGGNILWFYNKDLFDKSGVPYPKKDWTWDDFVDASRKLTRRQSDGTATQVATTWPRGDYLMPFIWTLGQEYLYLDKDYRKSELDKPASQFAHEQLWRMLHDWKVVRLPSDLPGEQNPFENGKAAMLITGPWQFPPLRKWKQDKGWDNWDVAPMWSYKGKRQTRQTPDGITNWSGSKQVEEGWDFIKFVTGEEGQKRITELGRGMPARVSLAKSASFARPDTPQKEEVFQEAMEYSGYQPVTKYWDEMWKIINKHYADMANPALQKKPDAFLGQMTRDLNTLLNTGTLPTGY